METPDSPHLLKGAALGDLDQELTRTRPLLERVPDEHAAWRPHERSMSLGYLASHVVTVLHWQATTLRADELDLATVPPPDGTLYPREELLRRFDAAAAEVRALVEALEPERLADPWTLRRGDQVFFRRPRYEVVRELGISHLIHHRAQLGVYLRLLDVPLPQVYGPTADEPGV